MTKQILTLWRLEADDKNGFGSPQKTGIAFEGTASLIPFLNTASIREDILDLHNGLSYHFFCREAKLPVTTVYIARCEKRGSGWQAADMTEEDISAAAFAGTYYLKSEEDDFAVGELYTLERAVCGFLMNEGEETWQQMCLQLYNALPNHACIYLNSYEDDMKNRNGMRLMFTSSQAKDRIRTASTKVLPLELLIRDIAEEDTASRGLSIMPDNGWGIMVSLPKEAVREIYHLYLMEVSGS